MTLTNDQINNIREQLISQVDNLPFDKKTEALKQINSLSPQALEAMLKQEQSKSTSKEEKGVFRMLVDGDIPSVKISENKVCVAILDIAPISKGHLIIIPKKPISDAKQLPTACFSLAKKLAKRVTIKLGAKSTEIQTETKFNEAIINVIPCYDKQLNINSSRTKSSIEELSALSPLIKDKQKIQRIKIKNKVLPQNQNLKMSRRVP